LNPEPGSSGPCFGLERACQRVAFYVFCRIVAGKRRPRETRHATIAQQKRRALDGGFLPSLRSLYDDQQILQSVPVIALGREAITNIRTRPISPFYMQIAPRIARAFNRTLRGDVTGAQAVEALQKELQTILRRNR